MRRPLFHRDRPPGIVALLAALLWLVAAVAIPSDPAGWQPYGLLSIPVELAFATLALVLLPPLARSRSLRWLLAGAVTALILLKLWDAAIQLAFGRPVDVYVDGGTLGSSWDLAVGMWGTAAALGAVAVVAVAMVVVLRISAAAIATLQRLALTRRGGRIALLVALAAIAVWGARQWDPRIWGPARPVNDVASNMVRDQIRRAGAALAAEPAFRAREADDPIAAIVPPSLFAGLGGEDVIIVFIESYGRTALEAPRYASVIGPRLEAAAASLEAAGITVASGWLTSPTIGGQSWLAHATLASGLWIDSQLAYRLLITGSRPTLPRLFQTAGYETVIVAPAIIHAWPEAAFFGFGHTLFADALGYAGRRYGWVTMPDQYTLAAFERFRAATDRPVFAEIDLVSSHAPWTPLPDGLVPWDEIGDGRVFDRWADRGEPPQILWLEPEKVRAAYTQAVDYALEASFDWAATFLGDGGLAILLGDHQPAPIIIGDATTRDVPVHVLAANPALVAPFLEFGFVPGTIPDPAGTAPAMSAFRDWFVARSSAAARPPSSSTPPP